MKNKKHYINLFAGMIGAFLFMLVAQNSVFLAQTPTVNPSFIASIKDLPNTVLNLPSSTSNFVAQLFVDRKVKEQFSQLEDDLVNTPLVPVAKGAFAKSNQNGTIAVINIDEVQWIEHTYIINGKEIKIKVPAGQQPPSQESVEAAN